MVTVSPASLPIVYLAEAGEGEEEGGRRKESERQDEEGRSFGRET